VDYKIHRPQPACSRTGRPFAAGDEFCSALIRSPDGLERVDIAPEAWGGPPEGTVAWWRSRQPAANQAGPVLAPIDALLDALDALADSPAEEPLRYLLALQLVRRRVLKIDAQADAEGSDPELVFSCRRRETEYRLRPVPPEVAADPEVAARLTALLWSGEAA
jgi:hypothetical protein